MTTRYVLSLIFGAVLVAAILLSIGAAVPASADATAFVGAGSAAAVTGASPAAGSGSGSGPARPSDDLADPVVDPAGAVSDARAAKQEGWALFALAVLIMIARGLGTARKRWPASSVLRWMAGRPGLLVVGVSVVGAAAFDALILGGSWWAAGYAAIGSLLSLVVPEPRQVPA